MTVRYNGPQQDIIESGDELSKSLLTGIADEISYEPVNEDDYTNNLTLIYNSEGKQKC